MLKTLVPVLAISIWLVAPAEATTTYYTGSSGETSFNTAVIGSTLLDPALTFSGSPGATGLLNASGTGIDFLGFDSDFAFNSPVSFTVNSGQLTGTNVGEVVKIAFPASGIYAFGFHITETSGTVNWCIDLTPTGSCVNIVVSTGPANPQFFGVVSDASITAPLYVHYTGGSPTVVFTNFEAFGPASVAPVPEPRTMLLVGLGLITLPLVRQKTGRKSPLQSQPIS